MFKCDVCGSSVARNKMISEVFLIDGKRVLVENIPVRVCANCGEPVFSRETTERVRRMVHGEAQPVGLVQVEVFAYA